MAFQIKNFPSIVASMINWMKVTQSQITDFNVGSVSRTLIEAPAIEIDELYQQMWTGLKEAIPVATYNSFNFAALQAQSSSGSIRVTITSNAQDVIIPAGSVLTYTGGSTSYVSNSDATIAAGSTYADILSHSSATGAQGNITAGKTFLINPTPDGFVSATNAAAFVGGTDAETGDQRKQRFNQYIQALQRGTISAITYGAKTAALYDAAGLQTERVVFASVIEPYISDPQQPIGLVNVYIHNGAGTTSTGLVTEAAQVLYGYTMADGTKVPGWQSAGVEVVVAAATEVPLNVGGTITVEYGFDQATLAASANGVVSSYIMSLDIGGTFEVAEMYLRVMTIDGISNFNPSAITDTTPSASSKLVPGTLSIA